MKPVESPRVIYSYHETVILDSKRGGTGMKIPKMAYGHCWVLLCDKDMR